MPTTIANIAALLNVPVRGGGDAAAQPISGVATLAEAEPGEISFLSSDSHVKKFDTTRASAVIVNKSIHLPPGSDIKPAVLVVDDADLAVARVLELFAPPIPRPAVGTDSSARVAPDAVIGSDVAIGPHVVVGRRCQIGAGTVLHAGVYVGDDVVIGAACEFFPNVVVRERITIGQRVVIHAGSVLGSDGFGYHWDGKRHVKIPQIGTVQIDDDVEIGSCVCIDRAKTGVTRVGRGTKIDNLVQVAHNCSIGANCMIVGQVGLAGSVVLGEGAALGGQAAVRDHVTLGPGAMAAGCSAVTEDVEPGVVVSGTPALPHRQSLREQRALRRLPDLVTQVRELQKQVEQLLKNNRGK